MVLASAVRRGRVTVEPWYGSSGTLIKQDVQTTLPSEDGGCLALIGG